MRKDSECESSDCKRFLHVHARTHTAQVVGYLRVRRRRRAECARVASASSNSNVALSTGIARLIPVCRGDADLAILQQTGTQTNARSTPGRQGSRASVKQRLPVPARSGVLLYLRRRSSNVELHTLGQVRNSSPD